MELALTNVTYRHHPHPLSLVHRHRPFSKSISFHKPPSFSSLTSTTASFRNPSSKTPKPQLTKFVNPTSLSFLKSTFVVGVTVTAIFLSRFTVKPAIATPVSSPPTPATVETADSNAEEQQEEQALEEHLCSHPEDTKALKSLMELKIKIGKVQEAVGILNQLINLEPEDSEWELLKNHLHSYDGDHESAKLGFEKILSKDPLRVEAYHGLVMAASAKESPTELQDVEKRILEGMEKCKKERKKDDLRDFKLLLAQIRVIQGDYKGALKIYEELSKEEPRDFRPYLCQGIIYTMLGKSDDAEKNFERYRRLVPKGHPYARYFDDNMVATKLFAEKVERERAYSKS
ncbi:protein SLOW GREEN 1, chloroplastic-like [Cynara cardunculus var. scolymus]|uniref:protein SLOW GREEN 1, chloroplastic-like n=1 Tax=Cynara cardunculus var. scolymus TaxID=59895 RepID=UPI000D62A9A7|nr:protein SLOW GREEN 1, chloroplastic-like [Cynara cardunculus var. scolymus]